MQSLQGKKMANEREQIKAVGDALAGIPEDHYWLFAKGRIEASEPLYAIQLLHPKTNAIIAEAEHDDPVQCIADALAKAKAA